MGKSSSAPKKNLYMFAPKKIRIFEFFSDLLFTQKHHVRLMCNFFDKIALHMKPVIAM